MIFKNSNLNTKTVFSLFIPLIFFAFVTGVFQRVIISPSFTNLEYEETLKNVERCLSAINSELDHLHAVANDWASFDDTYDFIQYPNEKYIEANLNYETLKNLKLNFIYYYNAEGILIWGKGVNSDGSNLEIDLFRHDNKKLRQDLLPGPVTGWETRTGRSGVLNTEAGPLLIAVEPILRSIGTGHSVGTLIFGKLLNEASIKLLRAQTNIPFEIIQTKEIREKDKKTQFLYKKMISDDMEWMLDTVNSKTLRFYAVYRDLKNSAAFIITAEMPRDIVREGRAALWYAWISIALSWSIITFVLLLLIKKNVLSPINRLTEHILRMKQTGNLSARLVNDSYDEIGILVSEFNKLTNQVDESKIELQEVNEELIRLNKQKDLLFSVLSHDLRNSFSSLSATAPLIEDAVDKGDLEKIRFINTALKGTAKRGEDLLLKILELIRIQKESNTLLDKKWIAAVEIIEEAVSFCREDANKKKISIRYSSQGKELLFVEPASITTCIRNMISNSIKFTDSGGEISIDYFGTEESSVFTIKDNGIGMDEQLIKNIVNGNNRSASIGTAGEIGTGFGLMMSREMIQLNGGKLEIKSTAGEGTVLSIILPADKKKIPE